MFIQLTEREKFIASVYKSRHDELSKYKCQIYENEKEINKILNIVKKQLWINEYLELVVSYSPEGKRKYFEYFMFDGQTKKETLTWRHLALQAAALWALGDVAGSKQKIKELCKQSDESLRI